VLALVGDDGFCHESSISRSPKSGEWWDSNTGTKKAFPLAELRTHFIFPLNTKSSVYLAAAGGSTLGYEDTGIPPFSLGGGLQLSAFGENELITNQY
jgi:NTE family protein